MKNLVRALALALVVTGVAVSNHVASGSARATVLSPRSSALPVPTCPPDDPKGCNICAYSGHCNQ